LAVTAPSTILDLRRRAKNLLQVHIRNLELMAGEAKRLLERGDIRDAAEKAYAAYKSLLGALVAKHIDRLEAVLLERISEDREKGLREARWWLEKGLEIPSRAVGPIALTLAKLLGDDEIALMADHAILLHKWFYGGDELVEGMTREKAEHTIKHLLGTIEKKARQHLA